MLDAYNYSDNVKLYGNIVSAEKYYGNACLVITRSGRNTLSELAFLGIPTISFVSGCAYRKVEQTNNINDLRTHTIVSIPIDIKPAEFADICIKMMKATTGITFQSGNEKAIKYLLQL